ncbi:MAG TPA: hypothetical protein VHY80_09705, partial [Stellaceae bacterium]|nr:hypothetical protein [Stellaceae bacterium]
MSYSLLLHFKPRLRHADVLKYFASRKHYKAADSRASYQNDDTGVYFWFNLKCSRDFLLHRTVASAELEINYNRPSFFAHEAAKELSAFLAAFQPQIEDPQIEGMGAGPYSGDGFLRGWNFGNRFAIQQAISQRDSRNVATMPAAELHAAWQWNFDCAERRDQLDQQVYVPTILFWRIDGRACRLVVWGESMPILLPRVDYVVVAREVAGKLRTGRVPWSEVVELAKRGGFDSSQDTIELRYLTPPPMITDWATSIPPTELKAHERLGAHQILDEELVAAARNSTAQQKTPRVARKAAEAPASFDPTPDTPQAFGYKISWFAVKASDPAAVVDALGFDEAISANWASGLEHAYEGAWVFVSPPINGWVLAIGTLLPYPVAIEQTQYIGERFDVLFSRLMQRFDDVQFFGNYRVVDFSTWARALEGRPIRVFGYAGGGEGTLANFGEQTAEEAQLHFTNLSNLSPAEAEDRMYAIAEQQEQEE